MIISLDLKPSETNTKKAVGETSEKKMDLKKEVSEIELLGQVVPSETTKADGETRTDVEISGQVLIEEGVDVDVKGFLSSKDRDYLVSPKDGKIVPVSNLEGKYVLICCFLIPFDLDTSEGSLCQSLQALYSHLQLIAISDFVKLVIVVKLNKQDDNASAAVAFDSFFSWFPLNCLAIPLSDSKSRDYVCGALGFSGYDRHPCVAIHPSGLVLSHCSDFLQSYGARLFPFTDMHLDDLNRYDHLITDAFHTKDSVCFLQLLLHCDHLSQIDNNEPVPISHLFGTPVGLYLYCDGSFMDNLRELHKSCRDKGLKFDVVVVPVPFVRHYDPVSFCDRMKQSALEDEISSSWWLFPFNDDICRTLWRITHICTDALMILPHDDLCGDIEGRAVASTYGIDEYPFTKDAIVQRKVNHLRSLSLYCLLGKDFTDRWDLHNKNVLVCFEDPYYKTSGLYKALKKRYCKIKQEYPDCEVVLVRLNPEYSYAGAEIDWRILPAEKCETVIEHIFTDHQIVGRALCAFGKDGKLLSRSASESIEVSHEDLFGNTLYNEILEEVMEELVPYV